jgi:excisionase family DNA binding protein
MATTGHAKGRTMTPMTYTIEGAVQATGLPRTTIYELLGKQRLSAVKAGRRTLILADSVRAYLESLPAATIAAPKRAA